MQSVHFLVCDSFCHISITLYIRTLTNWVSCGSGVSQVTRPIGKAMNIVWWGSTHLVEDREKRVLGSGGGSPLVRDSGTDVTW